MTASDTDDQADIRARLDAVERRLAALETPQAAGNRTGDHQVAPNQEAGEFWALDRLRAQAPDGGVVFAGTAHLPDGHDYEWQYGLPTGQLLDDDWASFAPTLTALAHPVRLSLLRAVLRGHHAIADLQAAASGTSGQLYHHLRQLVAAGWLRLSGRGTYTVPAERVVPLLTILAAAHS